MKLSKYAVLVLTTLAIGFLFYKVSIRKDGKENSAKASSQVLYDRVNYIDYTDKNFVDSKKFGRVLLFFAATTWCSNCRIIDEDIKKRNVELPKDLTILKVDYDNDSIMKAKYNVTTQTTLILLDKNGKEIKRFIGSNFNSILANIN